MRRSLLALLLLFFFLFNDTATTEIYTLSLHDALPICERRRGAVAARSRAVRDAVRPGPHAPAAHRARLAARSEEHTSELQSRQYLVCRLLLEKQTEGVPVAHPLLQTAPHLLPARFDHG